MNFIPAYCNLECFESFFKDNHVDLISVDEIASQHLKLNMAELILHGLDIKTDASSESVRQKADTNPVIRFLMKRGGFETGVQDFRNLNMDAQTYFNDINKDFRIYLTSKLFSAMNDKFQKESGSFFVSPNINYNFLFFDKIQSFNKGQEVDKNFIKTFFNPHHSLIIVDPYLFKNHKKTEEIIRHILPDGLKVPYHITLIGSIRKNSVNMTQEQVKRLAEQTKKLLEKKLNNTVFEYFIYDGTDFHDRYIISNTGCIFLGSGLDIFGQKDNKAGKESTWIAMKPFKQIEGQKFFYSIMVEKIKIFKKWILSSTNNPSHNPPLNPLFEV